MVYEIKLFLAVLAVMACAFLAARPAFRSLLAAKDYRSVWLVIGLAGVVAFFSRFPLIYFAGVAAVSYYAYRVFGGDYKARVAAFMMLILVFPPISTSLGGVGDINQLFILDHGKAMSLVLFGPAAFQIFFSRRTHKDNPFLAVDLLLVAYKGLTLILMFRSISYTAVGRFIFENAVEVFFPYYVMTRGLKNAEDIRFVVTRMMVGFVFIAFVGIAETVLQRSMYGPLQYIYGETWQLTRVLLRGGLLRVQATTPQPIVLAFLMIIALGAWTWITGDQWRRPRNLLICGAFLLALTFTWSRGPWLGAAILAISMFALSRVSWKTYALGLLVLSFIAITAKSSGIDNVFFDFLKSIFGSGEEDFGTIQYRREILDAALALLKQGPLFGVENYGYQLQQFRQGEGIVDIVNTYLIIALNTGIVGVTLYFLPQLVVFSRMLPRLESSTVGHGHDRFVIAFASTLLAVAFTLFTVSTIGMMSYAVLFLMAAPLVYINIRDGNQSKPSVNSSHLSPIFHVGR